MSLVYTDVCLCKVLSQRKKIFNSKNGLDKFVIYDFCQSAFKLISIMSEFLNSAWTLIYCEFVHLLLMRRIWSSLTKSVYKPFNDMYFFDHSNLINNNESIVREIGFFHSSDITIHRCQSVPIKIKLLYFLFNYNF